eukprot:753394-Hanusia_phi.AAC.2
MPCADVSAARLPRWRNWTEEAERQRQEVARRGIAAESSTSNVYLRKHPDGRIAAILRNENLSRKRDQRNRGEEDLKGKEGERLEETRGGEERTMEEKHWEEDGQQEQEQHLVFFDPLEVQESVHRLPQVVFSLACQHDDRRRLPREAPRTPTARRTAMASRRQKAVRRRGGFRIHRSAHLGSFARLSSVVGCFSSALPLVAGSSRKTALGNPRSSATLSVPLFIKTFGRDLEEGEEEEDNSDDADDKLPCSFLGQAAQPAARGSAVLPAVSDSPCRRPRSAPTSLASLEHERQRRRGT